MSTTDTDEFSTECLHGMEPRFCSICRAKDGWKPGTDLQRNDCTVRALSEITGLPYLDAVEILAEAGRKPGQGMRRGHLADVLADLGYEVHEHNLRFDEARHLGGTYLVGASRGKRGHAWVIRDGQQINCGGFDRNVRYRIWSVR